MEYSKKEQMEIAIRKLGGQEAWNDWLIGKKIVTVKDAQLFDSHGKRLSEGLQACVCEANLAFQVNQPRLTNIDYANRIMLLHGILEIDTGIAAGQFKAETEHLLALIQGNPRIANMAEGSYLPVVLPKIVTDDLGDEMDVYLAGIARSYGNMFNDREFKNRCQGFLSHKVKVAEGNRYDYQGLLSHKVKVAEGSRHDQLIRRLKRGPVVGIHFPNSLQGFSYAADREQMSALPDELILSGLDTMIALIMYPDIMAYGHYTVSADLAALSWKFADYSLGFRVDDHSLSFNTMGTLTDDAHESYSGGLLFIGS